MDIKQIDIHKAQELIKSRGITIVDIRDDDSYTEAHIAQAILVNDENVEEFATKADKTKPLICYCYHGISSQGAAQFFKQKGFQEVYSIEGGFEEWRNVYPSVSGNP